MSRNYLYLTGGLGNQLFQLAYAIFICDKSEVVLLDKLGNPRVDTAGKIEISHFQLPSNVSIGENSSKTRLIYSRTAGFLLRKHLSVKSINNTKMLQVIFKSLGSIILSLYVHKFVITRVARDIGYDESCNKKHDLSFLIGYFQSYRWASDPRVLAELSKLKPTHMSRRASQLVESAIIEQPIIVHVRLGDYLNESGFGIPKETYYINSLRILLDEDLDRKIWVFSDDIENAKNHLPELFNIQYNWIDEPGLTSAETLEVMKHGADYIIANSTFSWWGAFLSKNKQARVIAPYPWFKNVPPPTEIIPPNWLQVDAFK